MKSVLQKLSQLAGLADTKDVTAWENQFIKDLVAQCESGDTTILSENQVEKIEQIYRKHFA